MHINSPNGLQKARKPFRDKFSCKIIDNVAKHHNHRNSLLRVGFWLWAFKTPQPNVPLAIRALRRKGLHFTPLMFSREVSELLWNGTRDVIFFVITDAKTGKIHHFLGLSRSESVSSLEREHFTFGDLSVTWLRVRILSGKRNWEHVEKCRSCEAHVEAYNTHGDIESGKQ